MRVMVIGGAGFIGSHLVDRLLAEDHEVDVVDDLSNGSLANLAEARAAGGLKIHHLDAGSADVDTVIGMRRPEVIVLLSILPRPDRGSGQVGIGLGMVTTILDSCRHHGVVKVVAAVPAAVLYGHPSSQSIPVKEGALIPRGVNGVTARSTIDLLEISRDRASIEFTALALASVYGPRQRPEGGVVAAFLAAVDSHVPPVLHGDGRQTRDFVFVDDVVDAFVRACERGGGLVINIGTGEQTSIRDLWELVGGATGLTATAAPGRPDDLVRFAVSPVRARIHLAWSPWTPLDEGLARARSFS